MGKAGAKAEPKKDAEKGKAGSQKDGKSSKPDPKVETKAESKEASKAAEKADDPKAKLAEEARQKYADDERDELARVELRKLNRAAKASGSQMTGNRDKSIARVTRFQNRLKLFKGEVEVDAVMKDIDGVDASKYVSELTECILEAAGNSLKLKELSSVSKICSRLNATYEEFGNLLGRGLLKSPWTMAGEGEETEEENELLQPGANLALWGAAAVEVQNDPSSQSAVAHAVQQDGRALIHATPDLKEQKEVALKAVAADGTALMFVSENMKQDKDVVLAAVRQVGTALRLAAEPLAADRDVVLAAVLQCGQALRHAAENLRDDKEVCSAAVQQNGRALKHASERLRADKEVVDMAIENTTEALPYAGPELKEEWENVLTERWKAAGLHIERRLAGQIVNQIATN